VVAKDEEYGRRRGGMDVKIGHTPHNLLENGQSMLFGAITAIT
jgi:hypothetical protein